MQRRISCMIQKAGLRQFQHLKWVFLQYASINGRRNWGHHERLQGVVMSSECARRSCDVVRGGLAPCQWSCCHFILNTLPIHICLEPPHLPPASSYSLSASLSAFKYSSSASPLSASWYSLSAPPQQCLLIFNIHYNWPILCKQHSHLLISFKISTQSTIPKFSDTCSSDCDLTKSSFYKRQHWHHL